MNIIRKLTTRLRYEGKLIMNISSESLKQITMQEHQWGKMNRSCIYSGMANLCDHIDNKKEVCEIKSCPLIKP